MSATPSSLQQLVGRALIDADFRRALVDDTRGTLAREGFEFDDATVSAIEAATDTPPNASAPSPGGESASRNR